jgi:hypothetical protein
MHISFKLADLINALLAGFMHRSVLPLILADLPARQTNRNGFLFHLSLRK